MVCRLGARESSCSSGALGRRSLAGLGGRSSLNSTWVHRFSSASSSTSLLGDIWLSKARSHNFPDCATIVLQEEMSKQLMPRPAAEKLLNLLRANVLLIQTGLTGLIRAWGRRYGCVPLCGENTFPSQTPLHASITSRWPAKG